MCVDFVTRYFAVFFVVVVIVVVCFKELLRRFFRVLNAYKYVIALEVF